MCEQHANRVSSKGHERGGGWLRGTNKGDEGDTKVESGGEREQKKGGDERGEQEVRGSEGERKERCGRVQAGTSPKNSREAALCRVMEVLLGMGMRAP